MSNGKKARQRFRPERTGIARPLGELEAEVMNQVWANGETGYLAADIQSALSVAHNVALTTVLTTLDRLLQKGIVTREREGKAYRYHAAITEQQLERRIVTGVLNNLIARFPKAVATYFSQADTDANESASLDELARSIGELQRRKQESESNV